MNKEWLERIASDIEAKHGTEAREKIFRNMQELSEDDDSVREFFHRFVKGMDELDDKEFLTSVMANNCPCGHSDAEKSIKKAYGKSKTLEEFAQRLEREGIIDDEVSLRGNVLTLTKYPFEKYGKHDHNGKYITLCHCELASHTMQPVSDIFCHCCTVGFYGKMFKNALGVDVKVVFRDSYIIGGKACTADIYLPEIIRTEEDND